MMKAMQIGFNPSYEEVNPSLDEILSFQGLLVLEFGAPGCSHCKASTYAAEKVLSAQAIAHVKVLDATGKKLGRHFRVKLWPSFILLDSGQELARLLRPLTEDQMLSLFSCSD